MRGRGESYSEVILRLAASWSPNAARAQRRLAASARTTASSRVQGRRGPMQRDKKMNRSGMPAQRRARGRGGRRASRRRNYGRIGGGFVWDVVGESCCSTVHSLRLSGPLNGTGQFLDSLTYQTSYADGINEDGYIVGAIYGSPTPEPSTWAMTLIGFAGLDLAGWRSPRGRAALWAFKP